MNISASDFIDIYSALLKTDALIHAGDMMVDEAMAAPANSNEATRFHELFTLIVDQFDEMKKLFDAASTPKKEGK